MMAGMDAAFLLGRRGAEMTPFRVVEVMEAAWALEAAGRSVVHLVAGEPDFGTPAAVVEAAARFTAGGHVHYTASLGMPALRDAISAYYAERLGADVPARRIVVTTGASAALLMALGAMVDAGDSVLVTDPGYPCTANLVAFCGGAPVRVPVDAETRYQPDPAALEQHRDASTKAVIIGSPANPTGSAPSEAELAAVISWARFAGLACLVDEVYGELVYDRSPSTALSLDPEVFAVGSFSKTFGMTGWRLGWLVCPDWALETVTRLAQNLYISPPGPAQAGALAAFTPGVWDEVAGRLEVLRRRRDLIVDGLPAIGFGVPITPAGAFYVYADSSGICADSTELVSRLLNEVGVAVAPGNDFGQHGAERHVRFSYATSLEQIEVALERIGKAFSS